ncbi:glycosyl hydrolase [Niabella terrae]
MNYIPKQTKLRMTSLLLGLFFSGSLLQAQLSWPEITRDNRPWTRWWWEGSAVTEKDLSWNLEQYQKAGLGGVEITPIYGVKGQEAQFVDFLSPRWMELFTHTLKESRRLDLGVDLANATGWPFGGPWVTDADASKSVYHKTYTVAGGKGLPEPVRYEREGFVRTANQKRLQVADIKQPINANGDLQTMALDQVQFPGNLPLIALMAYSSKPGQPALDLLEKVGDAGQLNWTAPTGSGDWTLYAIFEGLHGKMVERAGPGGEGYAIDHFSAKAADHYFRKFDTAFKGYDISYLRGFFNDSYEVDDARGEADWTPLFFQEFEQRKGYDLRQELPALFGAADPERNSRVRYDYRSVIDALLLDHFTRKWKQWGARQGKILRNQSHGSPANTLDLYSVVDIPETEGTELLRFKFASSAANVSGKKLVAAESATWLNEHFLSSWGDVKKALDLYFLGGVNHIVYHGTAYSPRQAPWPGWLFYAAVHFQSENPQWAHFAALNQYVTRIQSFLQKGQPDNDILLYYPIIDRYSQPGQALLQHFDGMERNFVGTDFEKLAEAMSEKGYSFDFFSDRQLEGFQLAAGRLQAGGNKYRALMLPANQLITAASFEKMMQLVQQGATLLVYKQLPRDVPGLSDLDPERKKLTALLDQIKFTADAGGARATLGAGHIFMSSDLQALMQAAGARREALADSVYILRRSMDGGHNYFINNRSQRHFESWITLSDAAAAVAAFDPMDGRKGLARMRRSAQGGTEVLVQLPPFASLILQSFPTPVQAAAFPYRRPAGSAVALKGNWRLEFLEGGPRLPAAQTLSSLRSWTELPDAGYRNFSGLAKYSLKFRLPGKARAWLLDLGRVHETADLTLNGRPVGTLTGPNFQLVLPASAFKSQNILEIRVANLMANRIAYMDRQKIDWKIFYNINMAARRPENAKNGRFDAAGWQPLSSGLLGPVTLTPLQ